MRNGSSMGAAFGFAVLILGSIAIAPTGAGVVQLALTSEVMQCMERCLRSEGKSERTNCKSRCADVSSQLLLKVAPNVITRYGSDRSARTGAMNPGVKSEVRWVDVECWWSVWASRLSARTAKDPGEMQRASKCPCIAVGSNEIFWYMAGMLRQRQVKLQSKPDASSSGVTHFAIEIMEPVSFAQISYEQKTLR